MVGLVVMSSWLPSLGRVSAATDWQTGWPNGQPGNVIGGLFIGPTSAGGIYAFTSSALYRSVDAGKSWSPMPGSPKELTAVTLAESATIYTYSWASPGSATGSPRAFFRSVDGGVNWRDPSAGSAAAQMGPVAVLTGQAWNPQVILAGSASGQGTDSKIYRSTDGGMNWQMAYSVKAATEAVAGVRTIISAPSDPDIFYAILGAGRGGQLSKSADGGQSWQPLAVDCAGESQGTPKTLGVDPNDANHLLLGCDLSGSGGVRLARSLDGGRTWSLGGQGLPPQNASTVALVIDPALKQEAFAAVSGDGGGVYKSVDGGDTWQNLVGSAFPVLQKPTALVLDPLSRVLFVGTPFGVWQLPLAQGVDARFANYYANHDGPRVLGSPLGEPLVVQGWPVQYFEKGRLEDHTDEVMDPNWRFMFGLLVDDLQNAMVSLPVGGDNSTVRYSDLHVLSDPAKRLSPPDGFTGGTYTLPDSFVFVPFSPNLTREAGHKIPPFFWSYINRSDLFPGGWLHDIGLPMTEAVPAVVEKGPIKGRAITIQAFQRAVLTYDPFNPDGWQVERANVGTDYLRGIGR